jgi:hypothetical protein
MKAKQRIRNEGAAVYMCMTSSIELKVMELFSEEATE